MKIKLKKQIKTLFINKEDLIVADNDDIKGVYLIFKDEDMYRLANLETHELKGKYKTLDDIGDYLATKENIRVIDGKTVELKEL